MSTEPLGLDIGDIARRHYDAVFRFCARRIGSDRAADAAQETFLTAQRVLCNFRGDSTLTTWLFGIAFNECRRQIRMRKSEPAPLELDPNKTSAADSERTLVNREALRLALSKLSPEHREVVLLHEVEGLTYEEAGQILGVPEGTVKSRLHHAFQQLRRSMGGEA